MKGLPLALLAIVCFGCGAPSGKPEAKMSPEPNAVKPSEQVDTSEIGVELYPGSNTPAGLQPIIHTTLEGVSAVECWRETKDTPKKVGDFYLSSIRESTLSNSDKGVTVEGKNTRGDDVRVLAKPKANSEGSLIVISVKKVTSEPKNLGKKIDFSTPQSDPTQ